MKFMPLCWMHCFYLNGVEAISVTQTRNPLFSSCDFLAGFGGTMAPKRKRGEKESAPDADSKRRQLRRRNTEQQVDRVLQDSFADFGPEQIDGIKKEGKSLREELLSSRREKGEHGRFSANYLSALRERYGPEEGVRAQLQPVDEKSVITPALQEAMLKLLDLNPTLRTKVPLLSYLQTTTQLSEMDVLCLLRWVCDQQQAFTSMTREIALTILQTCARLNLFTVHPKHFKLLVSDWDTLLSQAWTDLKKERLDEKDFWNQYGNCAAVLKHVAADLEIACNHPGPVSDIPSQVQHVVSKSVVGSNMFKVALTKVTTGTLSANMRTAIGKLNPLTVDEAALKPVKDHWT